jgi:putative ABC transport system permease protein
MLMETLLRDIRFAIRVLKKAPTFTLVAVITIGLAIGATTSMFSVIDATLIRPLPFSQPDQLVMLYLTRSENSGPPARFRWAYPRFLALKQNATSFDELATFGSSNLNITGVEQPLRVRGEIVSASYFRILRLQAVLGRTFLPDEDERPGEKLVAVIGYGIWQRLFGGRDDVVGKTVAVNQLPFTIVGVLPENFTGVTGNAEVWIPNMMAPVIAYPEHLTSLQNFHNVVARLKPGVSVAQAQAELEVIGKQIAAAFPPGDRAIWSATAMPLDQVRIDPARRRAQLILLGAVGLVLLIACVNAASLLLSRAASREREMSIRQALGSSRWRIVRQLLTESVLLALLGGIAGIVLTFLATDTIARLMPERLPSPGNDYAQLSEFATIRVDGVVLAFAAGLAVVTGVLFGLAPAFVTSAKRQPLRRTRSLGIFIVTEFALALTLLVGAGLMIESFSRLQSVAAGFDATNVLTFYIQPPQQKYDGKAGPQLLERILDRVSVVPGVESATVSLCTPLMANCARTTLIRDASTNPPVVGRHYVAPDHFKTLRIPLIRGRVFTSADRIGTAGVAIVSEAAARRFWPNEDPIGKRIRLGSNMPFDARPDDSLEIVGVVGDVKYGPLDTETGVHVYTPYLQFSWWFSYFMVKTSVPPTAVVADMRRAVAAVDPNLPIDNVLTMEERFGVVNQRPRFSMALLSTFAALALLLAAIGVYGVTAHSVSARTKEIGIRMALGAQPERVTGWVLREGLKLVTFGVLLGIAGAFAVTRVLQSQLFEVSPTDPLTFGLTALILISVGGAACYFPARRASRVDPLKTLRPE